MGDLFKDEPTFEAHLHWIWDINLHQCEAIEATDDDSNEVAVAKWVLRTYRDKDGIADELTFAEIDFLNSVPIEEAAEVLRARDLL